MRKKVIAGLLVGVAMVSLVLTGCGNKKEANKEITVSIAASLQQPMDKIKDEFKKETGIDVNTVKYYVKRLKEKNIIAREGTSQKGCWKIIG